MRNRDGTWHGSNGTVMGFESCEGDDKMELGSSGRMNCFCECYPEFYAPFGGGVFDVLLQCLRVLAHRGFSSDVV